MRPEFVVHLINDSAKEQAETIAQLFSDLLDSLEAICHQPSREFSLAKTKLEEACFYAKKAMAIRPGNTIDGQLVDLLPIARLVEVATQSLPSLGEVCQMATELLARRGVKLS